MFCSMRYIPALFITAVATTDAFTATISTTAARCGFLHRNPVTTVVSPSTTILFMGDTSSTSSAAADDVPPSEDASTTGMPLVTEAASGTDILNSPQFLSRKRDVLVNDLQKLQNDIILAKEQLQQNKDEWGTQIGDLQTEYELIQQRMNTQSNANTDVATSQVVRAMLAVLDNFDRAFGQVTAQTDEERAIENEYKQVYYSILEIFKKLGVEEVPTVGIEFNYEIHQAVMQKPGTEYSEGIVCDELQKGFQINNTLIRAAMVAVAM